MVLHPAAMLTLWAGVAVFVQALPPVGVWVAALGLEPRLLSGEEEATASAMGALGALLLA